MHQSSEQTGQRVASAKVGWRVDEWIADSGIRRSKVYQHLKAGRLKAVKDGKITIILTPPAEFLAILRGAAA